MIYAIRAVGTEYIKFGYTSEALLKIRLGTLQIGCPFELEMVAAGPGTLADEQRIHSILKCAGRHLRGEWFVSSRETDEIVKRLMAYKKADAPIPPLNPMRKSKLARMLEYAQGLNVEPQASTVVEEEEEPELSPIERRKQERQTWWKLNGHRLS